MPPVSIRRRRALVAGTVGLLVLGGLTVATVAAAAAPRTAIPDTRPTWATALGNTPVPAVRSGTVSARIYLAGRDAAGPTAYGTAVSTPGNPLYHHYLPPAQVKASYGPTAAQVSAIESSVLRRSDRERC